MRTHACFKEFDVSVERKTLLMCESHLMSLVHMVKNYHSDEVGLIAKTDGIAIWYGQEYSQLSHPERANIYVHELMHGILMHVDRAMLQQLTAGTLFAPLWNYASDAIINESIEANNAMPKGMFSWSEKFPPIMMSFIHNAIEEAIQFSGRPAPESYNPKARNGQQVEIVYEWLVWAYQAVCEARQSQGGPRDDEGSQSQDGPEGDDGDRSQDGPEGDDGDRSQDGSAVIDGNQAQNGFGSSSSSSHSDAKIDDGQMDPSGKHGNDCTQIELMVTQPSFDLVERSDGLRNALEGGKTQNELIDELNRRIEDARTTIQKIVQGLKLQGMGHGSMLIELANDLPPPVVPWDRKLRKIVTQGLTTHIGDCYHRFGVATVSAIATRQARVPFSPGTTIFTDRPKVLIVLDVSGSQIEYLPRCLSEIWSIARMKNASVDIVTFDDGLQEKYTINNKFDLMHLLKKGLKGAGGTSLEGVFEEIANMGAPYRSVLIMTDGYLSEPPRPKMRVTWLITPGGLADFSYGEIIILPDYLER